MGNENKPKSSDNEKGIPNKFLMEMRQQAVAASCTERDESVTVDLLITQCHALVKTNQEIWLRCKPFYCTMIKESDSEKSKCVFFRVGHMSVTGKRSQGDYFSVFTTMGVMKRSFKIPINLPMRLKCLIIPDPTENDIIMPNYELLFQRSMLLCDDIIPGFLLEFKAFLETQHVALGKVDTWLLQVLEVAHFLGNHFGVDVPGDVSTYHELGAKFVSWERCNETFRTSVCSRCKQGFTNHNKKAGEVWASCPGSGQPGCFPLITHGTQLLRYSCKGTMEFEFCLDLPEQLSLLFKLVEFLRNHAVN